MESTTVIDLKNVNYAYRPEEMILENVSLQVNAGEFIGVVGPSGSGKTTLVKLLLGQLKPQGGAVKVLGREPREVSSQMGYVPQFADFPREFPISLREAVEMGRLGLDSDSEKVDSVLSRLDLLGQKNQPVSSLSGGQVQRLLLARALVAEPKVLLLDEPTASVDPKGEENIFDLLGEFRARGVTVVIVSHDVGFISENVDRVACVNKSLVCHSTSELTGEVISDLYGFNVEAIEHGSHVGHRH